MKRVYADKTLDINSGAVFPKPEGFDDCDGDNYDGKEKLKNSKEEEVNEYAGAAPDKDTSNDDE